MAEKDYNRFLVRLTPKVRDMLDKASIDMEIPKAHIINFAIKAYLGSKYADNNINKKLDRLTK